MTLLQEVWVPVAGYEGRYEVSSLGRVRSLNYNKTKGLVIVLSPGSDRGGYLFYGLCLKGKVKPHKGHRLVAEAFIAKPEKDNLCVNHKDGNVKNNRVENLEWMTLVENMHHSRRILKRGRLEVPVEVGHLFNGYTGTFISCKAAADALGLDPAAVWRTATGRYRHTKGYTINRLKEHQ